MDIEDQLKLEIDVQTFFDKMDNRPMLSQFDIDTTSMKTLKLNENIFKVETKIKKDITTQPKIVREINLRTYNKTNSKQIKTLF